MDGDAKRTRLTGSIVAVAWDGEHRFAKQPQGKIELLAGLGVAGDAHCGERVKHRSRVSRDPLSANLRQVHLLHAELLDDLAVAGFAVSPGQLGENVTTAGIDLLGLPRGARLSLGREAVVQLTGLRNPCWQIDAHLGQGAMAATLEWAADGSLIRKAGVMAIVVRGGLVSAGDPVTIELPEQHTPLRPV